MNEILRFIFLFYFITHIPISLVLDFQAVFGHIYPQILKNLKFWYQNKYHDFLIAHPHIWFKSFIYAEIVFQFPFFFFAIYCLWYKKNIIRIPGIIYGVHVATTLIPILSEFLLERRLREDERYILLSFYFPYFLIPVLLTIVLATNPFPFPYKTRRVKVRGD